jgi:hypothetical protein
MMLQDSLVRKSDIPNGAIRQLDSTAGKSCAGRKAWAKSKETVSSTQ